MSKVRTKKRKKFIKHNDSDKEFNHKGIETRGSDDDYPLFCFKYLSDHSIKKSKDVKFFIDFLLRLKKISELGWKEIRKSGRHEYGMEKIPVEQIHPDLPKSITPETHLDVFRANGNNLPFLGTRLRNSNVFRVLFIETKFGDIYKH